MHNEVKHTQMSEFGTEKGLLQGHGRGGMSQTPKYPRLPKGFQQSIFKSQVREESHSPLVNVQVTR